MHDAAANVQKRKCFSGLQNVCEAAVWYVFRREPERIRDVLDKLKLRVAQKEGTSLEMQFQIYISEPSDLPWANAVTMFMELNELCG